MNNLIEDYVIIEGSAMNNEETQKFSQKIRNCIASGYQPCGNLISNVVDDILWYSQVVVKYKRSNNNGL